MGHTAGCNRIGQGPGHMGLANNLAKGLWAIFTSKNKISHRIFPHAVFPGYGGLNNRLGSNQLDSVSYAVGGKP